MPHAPNCEWRAPAGCTCGNSRRNAAFLAAQDARDILIRLRANRACLERSRAVHAEWITWMEAATPEEREKNKAVGDADWHRGSVAMYDERIACIDIAINLACAALAREEAA